MQPIRRHRQAARAVKPGRQQLPVLRSASRLSASDTSAVDHRPPVSLRFVRPSLPGSHRFVRLST
eukprot:7145252-Pyramimonas_sp.AAC.1